MRTKTLKKMYAVGVSLPPRAAKSRRDQFVCLFVGVSCTGTDGAHFLIGKCSRAEHPPRASPVYIVGDSLIIEMDPSSWHFSGQQVVVLQAALVARARLSWRASEQEATRGDSD